MVELVLQKSSSFSKNEFGYRGREILQPCMKVMNTYSNIISDMMRPIIQLTKKKCGRRGGYQDVSVRGTWKVLWRVESSLRGSKTRRNNDNPEYT